jgi:hypothetical protein
MDTQVKPIASEAAAGPIMVNGSYGRSMPDEKKRLHEEYDNSRKDEEAKSARRNLNNERRAEEKRLLVDLEHKESGAQKATQDLAAERKRRNSVEKPTKGDEKKREAEAKKEKAGLDSERKRRYAAEKKMRDADMKERETEEGAQASMNKRLAQSRQEQRDEVGPPSDRKAGYHIVRRGDENEEGGDDKEYSPFRKFCGPAAILIIACIIALSQLQLAFETVTCGCLVLPKRTGVSPIYVHFARTKTAI